MPLLARLGRWYSDRAGRADLAAGCFQSILPINPNHDGALAGLCAVYQKAQQWPELGRSAAQPRERGAEPHRRRATSSPKPPSIFEHKLSDPARARELYQKILERGPDARHAREKACSAFSRARATSAPWSRCSRHRAEILRGEKRWATLARIAEVFEDQLDDLPEATRRYESILEEDEQNASALKGLDRVYNRTGRYRDLLGVLERQIRAAVTPRQRITLYERLAAIYEEEFIDHEKAAEACEADPRHRSQHGGAAGRR